jgi:hypothetical protein
MDDRCPKCDRNLIGYIGHDEKCPYIFKEPWQIEIVELTAEVERLKKRLEIKQPHPFGDGYDMLDLACDRLKLEAAENASLRQAICTDDSITELSELLDFAKDLNHAYGRLSVIDKIDAANAALKKEQQEIDTILREGFPVIFSNYPKQTAEFAVKEYVALKAKLEEAVRKAWMDGAYSTYRIAMGNGLSSGQRGWDEIHVARNKFLASMQKEDASVQPLFYAATMDGTGELITIRRTLAEVRADISGRSPKELSMISIQAHYANGKFGPYLNAVEQKEDGK